MNTSASIKSKGEESLVFINLISHQLGLASHKIIYFVEVLCE